MNKIKIEILPNEYLKDDGTFDKEKAFNICGKIAGVCYDKEGFNHLVNEPVEKTNRRISLTLDNGHHSVYDHIFINFNIHNIPKILSMIINNEHQYTTSEKSVRYTKIVKSDDSIITRKEADLYNKWLNIFKDLINKEYPLVFSDSKVTKLAQENARYLVTVFMPTEMIYTTSLRQINYLVAFMYKYIDNAKDNYFDNNLVISMKMFISEIERLNILDERLMRNEKARKFSLFGNNLRKHKEYFSNVYSMIYEGSFAYLAQAQRHRTINYQMEIIRDFDCFVPYILKDTSYEKEWLDDMKSVYDLFPMGRRVLISEVGTYDNFILKCKERLCSCVQVETSNITRKNLLRYKKFLEDNDDVLKDDIKKYSKGARCTFTDYKCFSDCHFKEGKTLSSKI